MGDLYYRDPALFESQRMVTSLVHRISVTLRSPRSVLGVCASPSGLVMGPVYFVHHTKRGGENTWEKFIPDPGSVREVHTSAEWVLVVEKHAVYQTLQTSHFLEQGLVYGITAPGALVTGKGYPDLATRWMLRELAQKMPSPHILFLLDADPHGVDIFR
ncbi:endodeoxyribonuclease [Malassezia vespertilionis]|uniref:endodeoxyribonuclease n=1 Tax=Malassezia vespertilionis TaxID=2020962 RepID=UPI0024B208D5|nr:endodeoxyribonuclease [Malassezia vespertilionis]WFD06226.1 endodeoxyribonuclease [Malassezia vespertilionis]